jgi:hypothetical protein
MEWKEIQEKEITQYFGLIQCGWGLRRKLM